MILTTGIPGHDAKAVFFPPSLDALAANNPPRQGPGQLAAIAECPWCGALLESETKESGDLVIKLCECGRPSGFLECFT